MTQVNISDLRRAFHSAVCKELLVLDDGVASNADIKQTTSRSIAAHMAQALGAHSGKKLAGQTAGKAFEVAVANFLRTAIARLGNLRPGEWSVECVTSRSELVIARYEQYSHLAEVKRIADGNPELAVFVGNDYSVASDIVVSLAPMTDQQIEAGGLSLGPDVAQATPLRKANNSLPLLHASVSCKWTMRSDRAQNSRFEALSLIRGRKGRVPNIVVVTGEPTPSRLASLALGTGDIDCVYHFALYELVDAVKRTGNDEADSMLSIMISGNRLRDISDLPFDLAI